MRQISLMSTISAALLATASAWAQDATPRAVTVAQATAIPECALYVDASGEGDGTAERPFATIGAAVAAASPGAVICVAEGTYAEELTPGDKPLTLAGGFKSGSGFGMRDSAAYPSKAVGAGTGSFLKIEDPAPKDDQLTAVDGFEISGYSRAIVRDTYYAQRFDVTNNYIHDNTCAEPGLVGAGFALSNISGTISGNVISDNSCDRGGAGFLYDGVQTSVVLIERNLVARNSGTEPGSSHGGAIYVFGKMLTITGNRFIDNSVTGWGAGLYVGAYTPGGVVTMAMLSWNVYRGNRAGGAGGGLFCDDGAVCISEHELFDGNCGANIYLDSGSGPTEPTSARFDHLTNVGALDVDCKTPGAGVRIDKGAAAPDSYEFVNALFWNNAGGLDFANNCDVGCEEVAITIRNSMVQREYQNNNLPMIFGDGNVEPADPLFADAAAGDFHLKSAGGRWTADGYVKDAETSPMLGKADPKSASDANPPDVKGASELGAYGNSAEASLTP